MFILCRSSSPLMIISNVKWKINKRFRHDINELVLSRLEIKRLLSYVCRFSLAGVEHEHTRGRVCAMIQYGELLLIESSTLTSFLQPSGKIEQTKENKKKQHKTKWNTKCQLVSIASGKGKRNLTRTFTIELAKWQLKIIYPFLFFSLLISV